ncbi:uncharacterized protein KZ484_010614 [Pholidichthys leucotaenia]
MLSSSSPGAEGPQLDLLTSQVEPVVSSKKSIIVPERTHDNFHFQDMDSKLITTVSRYPLLYDQSAPLYRDIVKRKEAWKAVSAIVGLSEEICRTRWRNLRDQFKKEKNKENDRRRSRSGTSSHRTWRYLAIMQFLTPHISSRPSTSSATKRVPAATDTTSISQTPASMTTAEEKDAILIPSPRPSQYHNYSTDDPVDEEPCTSTHVSTSNSPTTPLEVTGTSTHPSSSSHPSTPVEMPGVPTHPPPSNCLSIPVEMPAASTHPPVSSHPSTPVEMPAASTHPPVASYPSTPVEMPGASTHPPACNCPSTPAEMPGASTHPPASSHAQRPQKRRSKTDAPGLSIFEKRLLIALEEDRTSLTTPPPQPAAPDADELFFQSLLPSLKRLTERKKEEVKLKIHQLLFEAGADQ